MFTQRNELDYASRIQCSHLGNTGGDCLRIRSVLNIVWVVLGGLVMALVGLASLLCAITIVAAMGKKLLGHWQVFLWSFGQEAQQRAAQRQRTRTGTVV